MSIRTVGLTKRYGDRTVVDGVDLDVPAGSVYGLVGPNGAGKTTLLAMLAGLRRPSAGTVLLGAPRRRMAMLPDSPRFDPWLTGHEVVALAAHLVGMPACRAEEVLARTGLAEAAGRRVGGYSRGMLQRLGLAATLVGDPAVVLLDEPASALDPAGRRAVLDLIEGLRGRASVVLSSHLLADVAEACDTVGVLRSGRLLYQGPLSRLLVGRAAPAYRVTVRPPVDPVSRALAEAPWVREVRQSAPGVLVVGVHSLAEAEAGLAAVLARCGANVVALAPQTPDLEDVFLELTS